MYIDVILPIPLAQTYTYSVPSEWEGHIVIGSQVWVKFGKNKKYSGLVFQIRETDPESIIEIKPILAVESMQPVVRRLQLRFWEWLSSYYICTLGEIFKTVFPSALRTDTKTDYTVKQELFVRLTPDYYNEDSWKGAFDMLKRSARQEKVLLAFFQLIRSRKLLEIEKSSLLAQPDCTSTALSALIEKKILELVKRDKIRVDFSSSEIKPLNELNASQNKALAEIKDLFREKDVSLLYGVTASGKTEVYMHLIDEAVKTGKQVLYLLPEIALTTHLTERLKVFFGDKLMVYHSKVSDQKRTEIWNSMLADPPFQIIVGARSAVFLPFQDLGLVIVDEEHESSYKQQDPAPRYHARNAAIVLARMHDAKTLLGSATPSLESFYNAQNGKYGLIRLDKRYEEMELPEIMPVNVKELRRKKRMKGLFSPELIEKINTCLKQEEQVLLFHNRRGFSPVISCSICDWTPKCKYCDVSLTFHKQNRKLTCHYCGRTYQVPKLCPECENEDLKPMGFGTEKVEEEIKTLFPEVSVARLDSDTTKSRKTMEDILEAFEKGDVRILIGTQMVSKGLDFSNLTLAAILNADLIMSYPEFRSHEKAFQLMMQVAGRTGRRSRRGEVILQTSHPEHTLIQAVLNHDYEKMYEQQMEERELFKYPPFYRLIEIRLKGKKEEVIKTAAQALANNLKAKLGQRVIGPDKPVISRIQNFHFRKILLKIELNISLQILHEILSESQHQLLSQPEFKYLTVQYDVDPI